MIVKNDKSSFESYLSDAANIKGSCEKVFIPENEDELISIVKEFNSTSDKITISAARTGLNGGAVPNEGILISTEKLNKIISIDRESKIAIAQPGVVLSDLQKKVEKLNLFYPPDPTETNASIGGTVANNASGARTFKYGPTRNFVESLSVILSDGNKININRGEHFCDGLKFQKELSPDVILDFSLPNYSMPNVKHAAGYYSKPNMDLIDLFIGSEGTLGIISEIKLKLIDLPQNVLSMIIFFKDEEDIFSFVEDVREKSRNNNEFLDLREIEFFDKNTLSQLKKDYPNIPNETKGAIWIEQEFNEIDEDKLFIEIEQIIEKHNGDSENLWLALNSKERDELKVFRHKIALLVNDIISSRGLTKVGTDTSISDNNFLDFYNFTTNLINNNNLDYVVYGHIGNSHLHFNILPKTKKELSLARILYGKVCEKSVELGGTISAEHGIGKLKRDYLLNMFGKENILQMARLKKIFDPLFKLNAGNMFDEKFLQELG